MKILVAYPEELPSPQARAVQVISNAAGLAGAGAEVCLAYGRKSGTALEVSTVTGNPPPDSLSLKPLPLVRKVKFGPVRISWNWIFHTNLDRAIRAFRPDWIYCRHIKLAARLIQRRAGRVVYEAHTIFSAEAANSCDAALIASNPKWNKIFLAEKEIFRNADAVVSTSKILAAEIEKLFQRKGVHVFPHAVWPHHQSAWTPDFKEKRIVYVGQFYLWKDVDTLIHAVRLLPRDVKLDLIGGRGEADADRARLKILVHSLELQDRVHFLGQLAPAEVAGHMSTASVLVLTLGASVLATRFTCPIKLFEYLAGGRPVVATRLPIIEEMANGAVDYYRVGDPGDLARKLERLLASAECLKQLAGRAGAVKSVSTWTGRGRGILQSLDFSAGATS